MEFTPIKNNVLVELQTREAISKGGIHIPEGSQEASIFGTVRATGPDVDESIVDGSEALILRTSGTHFTMNGTDYVIVSASDIRAVAE